MPSLRARCKLGLHEAGFPTLPVAQRSVAIYGGSMFPQPLATLPFFMRAYESGGHARPHWLHALTLDTPRSAWARLKCARLTAVFRGPAVWVCA